MLRKQFLLSKRQIDFLDSISTDDISASEHVRRALDEYMKTFKREAVTSPSRMKVFQYGKEVPWTPSQ